MKESKNPRRAKGEGSLTQLKDGRWLGRYWVTKSDGTKQLQRIISKDKNEVIEKMRYEIAMAGRGAPVLRDRRSTGNYLEHWLKYIAPNKLRPSTLDLYVFDTRKYLIPHLGHIPLTKLGPHHLRVMINHMMSDGVGIRTMHRVRNTLSSALRDAMELEHISRNVAKLVKLPTYKPPERDYWTKSEFMTFIEGAKTHKYYPIFLLWLFCGMRRGEVLGLGRQHLDFENNIIKIERSLILIRNKPVLSEPKTEESKRELPMLPIIKDALLAHLAAEPEYPDDLVFHSQNGTPVHGHTIRKVFQGVARQLGLHPIAIHEARHTATTLLVEICPNNPEVVQAILGHASITTTLGIYAHTNIERKRRALNALEQSVIVQGNRSMEAPLNTAQLLYRIS